MSKAFRYTLYRRSIVVEYFVVEADSPEEALDIANHGDGLDPVNQEWIDYYDDLYELDDCDPEPLDPLYIMVKEYQCDTTS
jgi:hypothetical protein